MSPLNSITPDHAALPFRLGCRLVGQHGLRPDSPLHVAFIDAPQNRAKGSIEARGSMLGADMTHSQPCHGHLRYGISVSMLLQWPSSSALTELV